MPAHYGFVSPDRVPFNTRSKPDSCNSGGCTVTATIGDETLTRQVRTGVRRVPCAAYEPYTLERQDLEYFLTGSDGDGHPGDAPSRAADMADFLKKWGNAGSLILISSIQAPDGGPSRRWPTPAFPRTRGGSSRTRSLRSAARDRLQHGSDTAGSDYSLIGFGGAGEGGGQETVGKNMGIHGVLARDDQMRFRPANATDVGTPSELLTTETLKAPGSKPWPYADDAGVTAAMSYIGARTSQLGPDPRTAYWANHMSESERLGLHRGHHAHEGTGSAAEVRLPRRSSTPPRPSCFKSSATCARSATISGSLPPRSAAGADTWPTVSEAAEKLDKALGEPKSELKREIADRGLLVNFLDIASVAAGGVAEDAETILYSASAGLELGFDVEAEEDGSAVTSPSLAADEAAGHIHDRLDHISRSFEGLGDVIVSDYAKLQLIGKYGGCNDLQTQCPSGLEQLGYENPATAEALVDLAVKQSVYETVVPYYFPVADMGLRTPAG